MKRFLIALIFNISLISYGQSLQIINDDDFSNSKNQSFVLFNIRIIDSTNHYNQDQIQNRSIIPLLHIVRFDNSITKKWDREINAPYYIHQRQQGGTWEKKENFSVYQWSYLLEAKPDEDGLYFESITFRDKAYKSPKIPVFRKIAPVENHMNVYGTLEITINKVDSGIFVNLLNNDHEKANLLEYAKNNYPKIYNTYKDKINDHKLMFFFVHRKDEGEFGIISFIHYWQGLGLYDDYSVGGLTGNYLIFNSRSNGIHPVAFLQFKECNLPKTFNISYKSEWNKGEKDSPYGIVWSNGNYNKYFFYSTANGNSGIEGTKNGTSEVFEIKNHEPAGNKNGKNEYKIEVQNKTVHCYTNNVLTGSFEMNDFMTKECAVGFMVYDKQKITFSNLQITEQ